MTDRPYQTRIIEECRDHFRAGARRVLIQLPTGGGKTFIVSKMIKGVMERSKTAHFMLHRRELITQTANTFKALGIPFGIIAAGENCGEEQPVQIVSIGTQLNREVVAPYLAAWDECHHLGAATWDRLYQDYRTSLNVGMSATPVLPNGRTLGQWFQKMVSGPSVAELIECGYLSRFKYFGPDVPDMSAVRSVGGDYNAADVEKIMAGKAIVGNIVATWLRHRPGLTIGFAPTVAASLAYVEAFKSAGVRAAHLDANTPSAERAALVAAFAAGEIEVLWNVDLFGEGFDLAAQAGRDVRIRCVILGRPTKSLRLHKQQVGRGLRPGEGVNVILDHAGNWTRHGFPDDKIIWSLEDEPRRVIEGGTGVPITQCAKCFAVFRPTAVCPSCGDEREVRERSLFYMPGELKEIERQRVADEKAAKAAQREAAKAERERAERLKQQQSRARKKELAACKTLPELVAFARRHGYERPEWWAQNWQRQRAKFKRRG